MDRFEKLGRQVEESWKSRDFEAEGFPDISREILEREKPYEWIDLDVLRRLVLETETLPPQESSPTFSDVGVTVFHHPRFIVEVLCWLDASTSIHEHSFAGAFQVLQGSSLHAVYDFAPRDVINDDLKIGDLSRRSVEMLVQGDTREIRRGPAFIHRLFHLDHPSLSLVVRTSERDAYQLEYLPPGAAFNDFHDAREFLIRERMLMVMGRVDHPNLEKQVLSFFSGSDVYSRALVLRSLYPWLKRFDFFEEAIGRFRDRHGERADVLVAGFEELSRIRSILASRGTLRSPDLRYFLALLLLLDDRQEVYEWIQKRYTGDPKARVMEWLSELAKHRQFLQFDAVGLEILSHALEGVTLDELKKRLSATFSSDEVEAQSEEISALLGTIRDNPVLRPLFR